MSEEEIAASDLDASINSAKQRNKQIETETEGEVQHVQETVQQLFDSYKGFNTKIEDEMQKVRVAFEKLESEKNLSSR